MHQKVFYGCECVFLYEFFFIATYDSKSKNHCSVVWASDIKQTNKQKVKYTNLQFLMPVQKNNKCNFLLSKLSIWALDAVTALVVFVRFIIYIFQNTDVIVFYCSNITIIYNFFVRSGKFTI